MATERITIVVSQTGAVTVKKEIQDVGSAAKSSATAVDGLKSALGAYIGLQAAQKVGELADAGTRLTNSLKQAGLSGQALADEQGKLFDIATKNGQSVNELAGIFQKLSSVQGQLGASGNDVDKVMQGIAASMKLSSASSAAQAGSLQQLSQLFGGVNVQAQEYNSLIDGAYPLLQAVAAGSDRFRGSVSALTQAVKNSSVTTKEFFEALVKGSDANIALAASFNVTIGQALTNFNTKLIQLVLMINQSTGAFNGIANAINFVAQNLGVLLAILSPIIAGFTVLAVQVISGYFVSAMVAGATATGNLITMLAKLSLALLANPFTLFLTAGVLLLAFFVDWQKAIQVTIQLYGALKYAIDSAMGASTEQLKADVKIVLDAKQAAADIVASGKDLAARVNTAINSGASQAAPTLKKAVADGGTEAAAILKAGTAEWSNAVYQSLNGFPQKVYGAIQTGADYTFNQITGAVERSIPPAGVQAGDAMRQAIVSGGNTAAGTIAGAVARAGASAAAAVASTVAAQQAAQQRASGFSGYQSVDLGLGFIPGTQTSAEAAASSLRTEAIAAKGRGGNLSAANRAANGGDGHYIRSFNTDGSTPNVTLNDDGSRTYQSLQPAPVGAGVTIKNYIDPKASVQAIDTQEGNRTVVNVIKGNSAEIKAILGIV